MKLLNLICWLVAVIAVGMIIYVLFHQGPKVIHYTPEPVAVPIYPCTEVGKCP